MNWPNGLTLVRLFLGPAVLIAVLGDSSGPAFALFVVAMASDLCDGYLARRLGTVTEFGKFMDPLADKVLVSLALLGLLARGNPLAPGWIVLAVIGRELLVLGYRIAFRTQGWGFETARAAKAKTLVQMIWIAFVLLHTALFGGAGGPSAAPVVRISWAAAWILGLAAVALTVATGVEYFRGSAVAAPGRNVGSRQGQGRGAD
jgi:CDP-diacylglycerol--glycerol-3-phosphate 3-phosphatidyltransferase